MTKSTLPVAALIMFAGALASAQAPGGAPDNPIDYATARFERVAHAIRIRERIAIDGRLDEPAWARAEPATHFIQWEPNPGMPASEGSDVRFLYDDDNLYIGAILFDSDPAHLTVTELKEDFDANETDLFGIALDTMHDRQTGFFFATNPAGARRDLQVARDGDQVSQDWDGVWSVKVSINEKGWVAEFVIPFKTLRFTSSPGQEWGLNLLRRIRRNNEDADWAPIPRRYRINRMSLAGTLTGLEGIRQGRNLKVKPFVTGGITELGSSLRKTEGDGGLDVKYGVTPSMTLDATYRTDFSQVEADQQQVNLTRFNLLFPEKRDFFLENSGVFAVAGPQGSTANVIPFFSRRIGLSPSGTPIPIVGGARMSGKAGTYDVGLLAMKTGRKGDVASDNFVTGRLRKNFRSNSTVGAIVTSRNSGGGDYNRMYGVDTLLRVFEKLEVSSYLLRSETPGRHGGDQSRLLGANWRADDLTLTAQYEDVQPNFNPEVGFVRRKDMRHYSADGSWRPRPRNNKRVRNYTLALGSDYFANANGDLETREQNLSSGVSLQNGSVLTYGMTETFDRIVQPFNIVSVTIPPGDYRYMRHSVNYASDLSRAISGNLDASFGELWDGHSRTVGGTLRVKPSYHLNVDVNLSRTDGKLPSGNFVANLVGTRMLYAFSSNAFLNSFLQYNATIHEFSANTRFNIIHRPLSDLFLVYNERRDTLSGARLERAFILKFTDMFDF